MKQFILYLNCFIFASRLTTIMPSLVGGLSRRRATASLQPADGATAGFSSASLESLKITGKHGILCHFWSSSNGWNILDIDGQSTRFAGWFYFYILRNWELKQLDSWTTYFSVMASSKLLGACHKAGGWPLSKQPTRPAGGAWMGWTKRPLRLFFWIIWMFWLIIWMVLNYFL